MVKNIKQTKKSTDNTFSQGKWDNVGLYLQEYFREGVIGSVTGKILKYNESTRQVPKFL